MLYMLGPVLLSLAPLNATSLTEDGEHPFAEHPVLGTAPLYEDMGQGPRSVRLRGITFPHVAEFASGLGMLDVLEGARRAGQPLPVMRGDFVFLGYFVIERLSLEGQYLDFDGVPKELRFDLLLKACDAPPASSVYGLFTGMF